MIEIVEINGISITSTKHCHEIFGNDRELCILSDALNNIKTILGRNNIVIKEIVIGKDGE